MKLVELKCKNCGATLKADPELDEITCKYCQTTFKIDDEVKHVKFDDMEQNGYEFEKGRIRAQQENNTSSSSVSYSQPQKKSNKTLWLVLAWIFLLPFTATYFIAKSDKLDKKKKIIIIVVMWIVFFIFGAVSSSQEKEDKKNRIIECYSQEVYDKLDSLIGIDNVDGYFSDTYACDKLNLKDQHYKKIEIEMDGDKLVSIKLDGKDIYNIDPNVDIYDPTTLRVKEKNEIEYYKDNKGINSFINKFNNMYPDNKITSDMLSVYHHHGSDHKDQVQFYMDGLQITLTGGSSVYIDNTKNDNADTIKKLTIMFTKVFDNTLTDEQVEEYWNKHVNGSSSIETYGNIEFWSQHSNGKVSYMKITKK